MSTSLNAHLAVQRSAFSTATAAAKICDGRTSGSIATREAACNVNIADAANGCTFFVLHPTLSGGLTIFESPSGTTAPTNYKTHVQFDANNAIPPQLGNALSPEKFRCVSAALRLSCVNSAQFNNGWFEAIRVPTDYNGNDWNDLGEGDYPTPKPTIETNLLISSRWCNHPSYVTGKLADLYKHQFYLQANGDREFEKLNWFGNGTVVIDTNMDMVFVRVHVQIAPNNVPNAIHYHSVHHFEMMYDATSDKCRYHSQCIAAPAVVSRVDVAIKKDPKASMIRSPNSYGVNPY